MNKLIINKLKTIKYLNSIITKIYTFNSQLILKYCLYSFINWVKDGVNVNLEIILA